MGKIIDGFKAICMLSYLLVSGSGVIILFIRSLINSELNSSIIFLVLSLGFVLLLNHEIYDN